jgi:hypothetical protein
MTEYLYQDIFGKDYGSYEAFFDNGAAMDPDFLYDIAFGFQPRIFTATSDDNSIIYERNQYTNEMYFIT